MPNIPPQPSSDILPAHSPNQPTHRRGRGKRSWNTNGHSARSIRSGEQPQHSAGGPLREPNSQARNPQHVENESESAELVSSPGVERERNPGNASTGVTTRNQERSRRARFGSQLTQRDNKGDPRSSRRRHSPPPNSDLTTRLTFAFRRGPPHPDCPICFNPLYPAQPTWTCSLSNELSLCCWTTFHLKCVREWANKSVREMKDAFIARGEAKDGEWRCPGCQTKRTQVPQTYLCFCGAVTDPKPGIATPHSCGMPCRRTRTSCGHACPLSCHPGPCPPCVMTVSPSCYCSKTSLSIRCSQLQVQPPISLSCGQRCNAILSCGTHVCQSECHAGDCIPCEREDIIRCYCGKHSKRVPCGEGLADMMKCISVGSDGDKTTWDGRFDCGKKCEQLFICGLHKCSKTCHPPEAPSGCPFDPSIVTHCPCGKSSLSALSEAQRTKCTDPIKTCSSICGKPMKGCSHGCAMPCHVGDCLPCSEFITVPCRCGSTSRNILCHERQSDVAEGKEVIICDKVCGVLRLCGRHQCSRSCCPLALIKTNKGKKKVLVSQVYRDSDLGDAESMWHKCDLLCGKLLGCGSHKCEEADHRGPCPPCLQSSFEEWVCHCGNTIISPPIPCGTRMNCAHPCNRPPPSCGHAKTAHACHEDPKLCPPCPFLTTKRCACKKQVINNVRCSQQKVSCGQPCSKLLSCGFHRCQKLCHDGDCGPCSSACGKPKKLCLPSHHLCTLPCHAPSACDESEECETIITASCPCGHVQQPIKCGMCVSNPKRIAQQVQCRDECHIAKRNAKLAEALGISPDVTRKTQVTYSEELLAFCKVNAKFVTLVEKTLNDFVSSDKKTQVLPYMPETRRKFVRDLCQVYRIDTQLVDDVSRRSVQLYRRIDSRTPSPLLSTYITTQSVPNLGRLADLRSSQPRTISAPNPSSTSSFRGWTSVVSSPQAGSTITTANAASSGMTSTARTVSTGRVVPRIPESSGSSAENVPQNWEED